MSDNETHDLLHETPDHIGARDELEDRLHPVIKLFDEVSDAQGEGLLCAHCIYMEAIGTLIIDVALRIKVDDRGAWFKQIRGLMDGVPTLLEEADTSLDKLPKNMMN